MSHAVETMAYVGSTPWHGLGHAITGIPTTEEMLVAAGLDWQVQQVPIYTKLGVEDVKIPGKVALVRETDNKFMSITGENWKPLQNKDAMEFFREYTEAGKATLETAGSLHDGKVIWALANVNKGFTLNGRDQVNGYILLTSPHEVGNSISVRTTTVRVVCANTMAMAVNENKKPEYRQSHAKAFDVSMARETILLAQHQVELHEQEAMALQGLKLSAFDTVKVLAKHFQPAVLNEDVMVQSLLTNPSLQNKRMGEVIHSIVRAPGATVGNGWGVLNGVTHWADHKAGNTQDARLYNSWMGDTGRIKLSVKRDLLEMADYKMAA